MEFSSWFNTSLDLNSKPLRVAEEAPLKEEGESKLMELGRDASIQNEREGLVEELNRVSAENKKLTERLNVMREHYSELINQLLEYTTNNVPVTTSRKRSFIDQDSSKKPSITQVHVRTRVSGSSLIVKDGYQWRKYGQKVTRDNPSPRAYFKCSFAPTCPVKKKVQRSVEDQSVVVATYEGEHNHPHPSKPKANSVPNRNLTPGHGHAPSSPTITLDLTRPDLVSQETMTCLSGKGEATHLQHYLVEQMASTLTEDPSFKAALADAISGKFLQQNSHTEKW